MNEINRRSREVRTGTDIYIERRKNPTVTVSEAPYDKISATV